LKIRAYPLWPLFKMVKVKIKKFSKTADHDWTRASLSRLCQRSSRQIKLSRMPLSTVTPSKRASASLSRLCRKLSHQVDRKIRKLISSRILMRESNSFRTHRKWRRYPFSHGTTGNNATSESFIYVADMCVKNSVINLILGGKTSLQQNRGS